MLEKTCGYKSVLQILPPRLQASDHQIKKDQGVVREDIDHSTHYTQTTYRQVGVRRDS